MAKQTFFNQLTDLLSSLLDIRKYYEEYIDRQVVNMHRFICDFCDARNTNNFFYDHQNSQYVEIINIETELENLKKKLEFIERTIPLVALGNISACLFQKNMSLNYKSRDMDFKIAESII